MQDAHEEEFKHFPVNLEFLLSNKKSGAAHSRKSYLAVVIS